ISTSAAAPVEIVVHRQHLPTRETTQLRGAGSVGASRGHKDRPRAALVLPGFSGRRASAANIYAPPSPTMIGPHPHDVVAITIRIVRIAIGQAYPKRDEVPEVMVMVVVVVVEAPTGHSGEACSARHGSNPGCTKSAGGWVTRGAAAARRWTG